MHLSKSRRLSKESLGLESGVETPGLSLSTLRSPIDSQLEHMEHSLINLLSSKVQPSSHSRLPCYLVINELVDAVITVCRFNGVTLGNSSRRVHHSQEASQWWEMRGKNTSQEASQWWDPKQELLVLFVVESCTAPHDQVHGPLLVDVESRADLTYEGWLAYEVLLASGGWLGLDQWAVDYHQSGLS